MKVHYLLVHNQGYCGAAIGGTVPEVYDDDDRWLWWLRHGKYLTDDRTLVTCKNCIRALQKDKP